MNISPTSQPITQRSSFVTVVAWLFIVLAGFTTFISVLQNVMFSFMVPVDQMTEAMNEPNVNEQVPAFARFIFSNFRLFLLGVLAVSSTTLVSAIGLLKRKNWGRIIFIFIMAMGILWNVFALVLQHFMFNSMPGEISSEAADSHFGTMMLVMKVFSFIMAIGISALFGWIIKKLISREIKTEFTDHRVLTNDAP